MAEQKELQIDSTPKPKKTTPNGKKNNSKKKKDALVYVTTKVTIPIATSFTEQVNLLATLTPHEFIKQRKGRGGRSFDYVETNYVIGRLNATFNYDWDIDIVEQIIHKEIRQIATKVRLTVRFADGRAVSKAAWGGSEIKVSGNKIIDFADDLKASESDGLKKAASMLGVCWDVYAGQTNNGKEKVEDTGEISDVADMAQDELEEKEKIAEDIKKQIEGLALSYKDFKIYLINSQSKWKRKYCGLEYGNPSLVAGKVEDLRHLKDNLEKALATYQETKMGE